MKHLITFGFPIVVAIQLFYFNLEAIQVLPVICLQLIWVIYTLTKDKLVNQNKVEEKGK